MNKGQRKVCLHISANQFDSLDKINFTGNIWKELAKDFDEYHILTRHLRNRFDLEKRNNIFLHRIPALTRSSVSFIFSSLIIFWLIPKYKVTHLLAQSSVLGGLSAAIASKLFKIPLMTEVHGEEYFTWYERKDVTGRIISWISKYSFNNSTKVRSLNSHMTVQLTKWNIKNIVEIENRVDLNIFNKQKSDYKIGDLVRIVSIGRFVNKKNYINLIHYLFESNLNIQLTLIGGGDLIHKYRETAKKLGKESSLVLIEWINQKDMIDYLYYSDIYIQNSVSEGMPRTILEAMAMRLPIISSDVSFISGTLINNFNSLLVKVNEPEELYIALDKIINDEVFRSNIGQNAYNDILEKYEWNKAFDLYRNELVNMKYR